MLESLKLWFEYVFNDDYFVIAILLDPRFKATFFEEAITESATQTLLTICGSATHQGSQKSLCCMLFAVLVHALSLWGIRVLCTYIVCCVLPI